MPSLAHVRRRAAIGLVLVATLVLAACGASGSSGAAPNPAPSDPGPAIDIDALLGHGSRDGHVVRATGFFLTTGDTARLCSVVLESYPPQCGGGTVRITGTVPAAVLTALETTTDPALAKVTWGQVEVTGTFKGSGVDGLPTIELATIEVLPPIEG